MNTRQLWYDRPAERWKESIPIGNGSVGAMVYGTVSEERLSLNEETIWENPATDYHNPKALEALPKMRQLLFEGKLSEAEKLARECFVAVPRKFGAYQPCADLIIMENDATQPGAGVVPKYYDYYDYKRLLDMENGIVHVDFVKDDVKMHREYFASYIDQVLAVRYVSEGEPMDYALQFQQGAWNVGKNSENRDILYHSDQMANDGVCYIAAVKAVAENEGAIVENNKIVSDLGYMRPQMAIKNATSFVLYIAITTDYHGRDEKKCFELIENAAQKGYDKIKADHIQDFSEHYNRFYMELGEPTDEDMPLTRMIDRVRKYGVTPKFAELHMNFTRYMMISATRKGTLPSNLQGIWNGWKEQSWESDFHTNINMQMNYWSAQAWGLSDCEEPLVDWMEMMTVTGAKSAKRNYGISGWTVHHCTNADGYAEPNFDVVGIWPMGSAWWSRHLYEMWQYNRDYDTLRNRYYPIIRGSADFVLEFLVEAPEGTACPGMLVTNPSVSPENNYRLPNGEVGMLTYACTMDIQILMDFFENLLDIIEEIQKREAGFEAELVEKIKDTLSRLPKEQIRKNGGLQEWIEDYEEDDPGHRHISHLYGVYPGKSISVEKTPELAKAAARTIDLKYEAGYDGQGWSMGWQACVWARLKEGERAYAVLDEDFRRHMLPNLMINSHGIPQVGDAYGIPSTILELLVQSHEGKIELLPALPKAWGRGCVRDLRVRGGYTVDMEWKDGRLVYAEIRQEENAKAMPIVVKDESLYQIVIDNNITVIKPI